ncbi:S41 family peptidase [Sphingobacterium sp. HJSM2_6]|uniref:S41 family peptidase n=1 Tax=Sphingobacterium sp. HJSM2_6 TaxID=3366264 RepID=UPI003BDF1E89
MLLSIAIISCQKDPTRIPSPPKPVEPVDNRTEAQKIKDSIYYYYKMQSYWESSIEVVNPISTLTDKYTGNQSLLNYLMGQTPLKNDYVFHKDYNGPFDRFSFIEDISASSENSGKADTYDGFGLFVVFESTEPAAPLYIGFVEGGSPADDAGLKRGDKITSLNGNTNITYSNFSYVNNQLNKTHLDLVVLRGNQTSITVGIDSKEYEIYPIVKDSVFTVADKKVGYLAYSSFEELAYDDGSFTKMRTDLERIFSKFAINNIKDIIIDIRYNGGGYVSTATYLANKVINTAGNNKLMFSYDVNKNLQSERSGQGSFKDVNFRKNNNTEIQNVYFLVSDYTASASEILISVLKPYMNVQIIAEVSSTYGKPVGFFPQKIMDKINLWAASFKVVNSAGYSDYWDGIEADKKNVLDDISKDFGDTRESMTAMALAHIETGVYPSRSPSARIGARTTNTRTDKPQPVNKIRERNLIKDRK